MNCAPSGTTSVRDTLSALAFELNRQCGRYGRLAFPRFVTGQLVIAQDIDHTDHQRAHEDIQAALENYRKKITRLRAFLSEMAAEVLTNLPLTQGIPGIGPAGKYTADLVLGGLISWRRGRRVVLGHGQEWYGHQDRGLGRDPIDVLVALNRQAATPDVEDNQREVHELLWAAFLADLRDGFRRNYERSLNCVVLLDDVDTPAGRGFIDGLLRARSQHAAHSPDDPDPLTVVATSRGAAFVHLLARGESIPTLTQASYADCLARSANNAELGRYPVLLGDLSEDEVANMVDASIPSVGRNRRITSAVHRFTGGHPGATRSLIDVIAEAPDSRRDLNAALTAVKPQQLDVEPTTVEAELVSQFLSDIPDEDEDLVTLSAAQDRDRAQRLAAHSGLLTSPHAFVALRSTVLGSGWRDATGTAATVTA